MATDAQINANRQNAQKSTGPRTDEGKAASSQNSVKHGLFAHEAVIHGESQADFEMHREALLEEWRPVGPTESMLAERIVSLSWRLCRVERMESQALDDLIIHAAGNGPSTFEILRIPIELRKEMVDGGALSRNLSLGQAVVTDFTNYRVLDRLTLYERRIECGMYKTINELKKLRKARRAEQTGVGAPRGHSLDSHRHRLARDLNQHCETNGRAAESHSPQDIPLARGHGGDPLGGKLKKQTQLATARRSANSCLKDAYGKIDHLAASGNEPNQTRSQGVTPAKTAGGSHCSSKIEGRVGAG